MNTNVSAFQSWHTKVLIDPNGFFATDPIYVQSSDSVLLFDIQINDTLDMYLITGYEGWSSFTDEYDINDVPEDEIINWHIGTYWDLNANSIKKGCYILLLINSYSEVREIVSFSCVFIDFFEDELRFNIILWSIIGLAVGVNIGIIPYLVSLRKRK